MQSICLTYVLLFFPYGDSFLGCLRILRPARVGGEGNAGDHRADVPHFLHESGETNDRMTASDTYIQYVHFGSK